MLFYFSLSWSTFICWVLLAGVGRFLPELVGRLISSISSISLTLKPLVAFKNACWVAFLLYSWYSWSNVILLSFFWNLCIFLSKSYSWPWSNVSSTVVFLLLASCKLCQKLSLIFSCSCLALAFDRISSMISRAIEIFLLAPLQLVGSPLNAPNIRYFILFLLLTSSRFRMILNTFVSI